MIAIFTDPYESIVLILCKTSNFTSDRKFTSTKLQLFNNDFKWPSSTEDNCDRWKKREHYWFELCIIKVPWYIEKWRDWKEGVKDDSFRCQYEEITRKSWCICKSLRYRSNCVLKVIWVASRRDLPFQLLCYIAKEMRYEIQRIWLEVIICKLVVLLKPANIKTCFVFWRK